MPEIAEFVRHRAERVTPNILQNLVHQLPMLKAEFTQIDAPKYPHLVDQLNFLADVVEDFAENVDKDLPLIAIAESVFALAYAHRAIDLIPDTNGDFGWADDSAVVRAVLIRHEAYFRRYALEHDFDWSKVTNQP